MLAPILSKQDFFEEQLDKPSEARLRGVLQRAEILLLASTAPRRSMRTVKRRVDRMKGGSVGLVCRLPYQLQITWDANTIQYGGPATARESVSVGAIGSHGAK